MQIEKYLNLTWNSQRPFPECFPEIIEHMDDSQADHEYVAKTPFQNCWEALDNKFSACYGAYCDEVQQNDKLADELYHKDLLIHQLRRNIRHLHSKVSELELELNIRRFVSFNSFNIWTKLTKAQMGLEQHNIPAFPTCCIQAPTTQKMDGKFNSCQGYTLNDLAIAAEMVEDKLYVDEGENLETLTWSDWSNHSCILYSAATQIFLALKEIWIQNSYQITLIFLELK